MKKLTIFLVFLLFVGFHASAQMQITGTVTGSEDGMSIPGVSVVVKGQETIGTTTDIDGKYSITVPQSTEALVFSFIGMVAQEISINGKTTIDVVLEPEILQMDEVVVTANAIKREKRSIGYSVSTVGGDDVNKTQESDLLKSLSGKVAGVDIRSTSGDVGGSTRILIRGASSLTGTNQPLFVVDGVPISNSNYVGENNDRNSGYDTGNRGSDINPDDIETISVLKGGAAAALYGSRARDGAIIITTKRGKKGFEQKSITYNGGLSYQTPFILPDYQNEYAQGTQGKYVNDRLNGWGPKISEMEGIEVEDINGDLTTLSSHPNNVKDFYDVGQIYSNSLAIAGADEKGDYRLGYTNYQQKGIVPESKYARNTISFNAGRKFANKFSSRITGNYIWNETTGRVSQGGNNNNAIISLIHTLPRTFDLDEYKQYENEDGSQKKLGDFTPNPYWIINKNKFSSELNRLWGNFQLDYDPFEWLNLMGRVGTDMYREYRRQINAVGSVGMVDGQFADESVWRREFNSDLMLTAKKAFGDLNVMFILGHNVNQREFQTIGNKASSLTVAGLYNFGNAEINTPTNYYEQRRIWGVYSDLTLSYKNFLFLNATLRNDHSSTLPEENNSYWYPSVSGSAVITDAFPGIKNNILSYLKIRANYAQVGSDEGPYQLDFTYTPLNSYFVQFQGTENQFPHGDYLAFGAPNTIPPTDLKPQKQNSYEIGMDLYLFDNRLGFDFAYYSIITSNQIVSLPIPWTTGYTRNRTNVGEVSNKGIELRVTATPVSIKDFKWDIGVNFSKNTQIVEKLAEGVEEIDLGSSFNSIEVKATPGDPYGLFGKTFRHDPDGNLIINETTGLIEISNDVKRLGNIDPDWTMGIQNTFKYKGITLSALIDIREGGVMYSETVNSLRSLGLAKETGENREATIINNGVNEVDNGDGTFSYVPNETPVGSMQEYWQNYADGNVAESALFDADYIKLREVRLGYQLPKKWLSKTPFGLVEISAVGRNLWLIKSEIPHIDPESSLLGSGSNAQGIEWWGAPSTTTYGFNLRLTF